MYIIKMLWIVHAFVLHTYVGRRVPFSNPSGVLTFLDQEDSIKSIYLMLINNETLEVCMYIRMYIHVTCLQCVNYHVHK